MLARALIPLLVLTAAARADLLTWYAASYTLPTSVGWQTNNTAGANISLSTDGMTIGPTTFSGVTAFTIDTAPLNAPGQPVTVEVVARIVDSTYGVYSGYLRGGYEILIADELGRFAIAEIGQANVALRTVNLGGGSQSVALDTTAAFHTYRLTLDNGHATLAIDGAIALEETAPVTGDAGTTSVSFSDATILGNSTSITQRVILSTGDAPCNGADLVAPLGTLNFFDVSAYLDLYNASCL